MPSSNEIKQWLVEQFESQGTLTRKRDWKRTKKHKDDQGRVRRVFTHPALGDVAVVETIDGLALDAAPPPGNSDAPGALEKSTGFTRPTWTHAQIQAAGRLMDALRDGDLDPEDAANHPDYLEAYPCLPSHFSFCFPPDTYGNEGEEGRALGDGLGELCIRVDEMGGSDPEEYLSTVIFERLESLGLASLDENHWGVGSRGKSTRIEEMVRKLLGLGLNYNPEECMLARPLTAAGATQPTPVSNAPRGTGVAHASKNFFEALKDDNVLMAETILQQVSIEATLDMGDGRTWARAAYEAEAFSVLSLLLRSDAPVFGPTDRKPLTDRRGMMLRGNHAEQEQDLLRLMVEAKGWDPEHPLDSHSITQGRRARDEWAQAAWPDRLDADIPWVNEAWDLLAQRVGEADADESFVHVWCRQAFVGVGGPPIPTRVSEALKRRPELLDTWPDRDDPRPWQALTKWGTSPSVAPVLFETARMLEVDLPNLGPVGEKGQSFLEWARERQQLARQALEQEIENSRGGFIIVTTHHDGRRTTGQQECEDRWSQAMAVQRALEGWGAPGAGRRPGP